MIVTDRFVFVHLPKTGGTFVSKTLLRVAGEERRGLNKLLYRLAFRPPLRVLAKLNKHGKRKDIPHQWCELPVIGCVRHPHDWYVSNYRFGWWRQRPQSYPGLSAHPSFPELSFSEYLKASSHEWVQKYFPASEDAGIGRFTLLFLQWFSNDFDRLLPSLSTGNYDLERIQSSLKNVTFLNTGTLNQDLAMVLGNYGFGRKITDQIQNAAPIFPNGSQRKSHEKWSNFYSAQEISEVYERDRLIFQLFPDLFEPNPHT